MQGSEGWPGVSQEAVDPSNTAKQLNHFVRLAAPARSAIEWWHQFYTSWNGTSMMSTVSRFKPEFDICCIRSLRLMGVWGHIGRYVCGYVETEHYSKRNPPGIPFVGRTNYPLCPVVLTRRGAATGPLLPRTRSASGVK